MLPVDNIDLSPKRLFQNTVAPKGLLPPASATRGGTENSLLAGASLLTQTFQQLNTASVNGLGGKVDLLG